MPTNNHSLKSFRVRVGHWEVQVRATTADQAIETARRQMACELPRLYDVIRGMTAARFQVEATV